MTSPRCTEFFAGIGLARLGLEDAGFNVVWSNDIDAGKAEMYRGHFAASPDHVFVLRDIAQVFGARLLSASAALAWASFPCTDLSIAGNRVGLDGSESSAFWHFARVLRGLGPRRPPVVVLENVIGLATSHGGADLAAVVNELNQLGYSVDVLTLDARRFVPQSRPRLFIIGAMDPPRDQAALGDDLRPGWLRAIYGDSGLRMHRAVLPAPPPQLTGGLTDLVERFEPGHADWWDDGRVDSFLRSLSPTQEARLADLRRADEVVARTAYRRTRGGLAVWEIRADDISGCLRTARGGSSKQALVQVGSGQIRVRWMTPREYARLMGAPDYRLDGIRRNQALSGFGDAVCVPAVSWLAANYLMPLVQAV